MADSQITIKVSADTATAVQGLRQVGAETEAIGKTAEAGAKLSSGAVLQLGGSVMSLKNGLSALAGGRGGVGSLLQVAGAARGAGGALKGLGVAGGGTAVAIGAGFALAAAAVVGVGLEVGKSSMGTEKWKETSNNAVESVIGMWGKATKAVSEYWKQTAVGSFFEERGERKKQVEVQAAREQVEEAERLGNLTGEALRDEIKIAEVAGDAAKVAQLYAKSRKEAADAAKREKEDAIATANHLQKFSKEQDAANKAGEKLEREEGAINKAREIAKNQDVKGGQAQRLEKLKDLVGPATGKRIETALTLADPGREAIKQAADPGAQRQLENNLVGLAKSGVAMEKIVATLADAGLDGDEIVTTLDKLEKRLPEKFASEIVKAFKIDPPTWGN